jgi:hypothetical protein
MAITPLVSTLVVEKSDNDGTIQTWLNGITITNVYGFTCIPISNTQARLVLLYE